MLINGELEKVLVADGNDGSNYSSGRNSHASAGRSSHASAGRSSHASTITLSGKPMEGTESSVNGTTVCPLQGYLFGTAVGMAETKVPKKENRTSLGELFEKIKMPEEYPGAKHDRGEKKSDKESDKSAVQIMKKILKKKIIHASSRSSTASSGGTTDSASADKKLPKILHMFHRKVHPENSVSTNKPDKLQKEDPKNMNEEGDTDIVIYPRRGLSKKGTGSCKNHIYPPQGTLNASESDGNREHWIKTDADSQLLDSKVDTLRKLHDVIAIRPDRRHEVHTTYSYKFLGLSPAKEGAWMDSNYGRGAIIGVLDTGVWPESPSFSDQGLPPVPKKWKGICQLGEMFNSSNCNRKIIGARYFSKGHCVASLTSSPDVVVEYISVRDSHGHGTHTASTAAGAAVPMANVLGNGAGEARGMAPDAHIAVYEVCWFNGCYSSDILAAMDVAIRDGVDVLSLSLGGFPIPLYEDSIAIGSFRAMEHGISVVCAAGNNGTIPNSVANEALWIATVGASTLDRRFPAIVRLSNGKILYGESMYPGKNSASAEKEPELVYHPDNLHGGEYCMKDSLPRAKVQGKMVVCDRGINGRAEKGQIVKEAAAAAMILANKEINQEEYSVDAHVLPATLIGFAESVQLKKYINSTNKPRAQLIFGGTSIGKSRAAAVAQFSSRGPSFMDASILKPDMIAPGVNVIAAWLQNLGPAEDPDDSRRVNFTVMSGTSMACPHVGGIAVLIHSAHPKWTPAAIKSALVTTTYITDHSGKQIMDGDKPAELFAIGAGHVNPAKAISPGLIYDISPDDYVTHLCTLKYTQADIFTITQRNVSCQDIMKKNRDFSLNYPSISVVFRPGTKSKMIKKRLTNVGSPNSTYSLEVKAPNGIKVRFRPRRLTFKHINQSLSYRVLFISRKKTSSESLSYSQGHLSWVNSQDIYHRIRSPISITWSSKKAR